MCLIVFAWLEPPGYRLVLAANRDERHDRPAAALDWWPDADGVLAGRDLEGGGTWLAVARRGRFAAVTNYRERSAARAPSPTGPGPRSRGELVAGFVGGDLNPRGFFEELDGELYAGFSLLVCDGAELWYGSNRGDDPRRLEAGIYGLGNASLDTPWPKLERSKRALATALDTGRVGPDDLFDLLSDRKPPTAGELAAAPLPDDPDAAGTAPFIVGAGYGTRCTTALAWTRAGEIRMAERTFDPDGKPVADTERRFRVEPGQAAA